MPKRLFSQTDNNQENNQDNSKGALPLSKSNPELVNGIPLSGEDYLLVVRQQARKCAQTVVAPAPKHVKEIQLPAHFQFFNDDQSCQKDAATEVWRKGFIKSFKSYQKYMQTHKKPIERHREIKTDEEAHTLLYINDQKESMSLVPKLSQPTILRMFKFQLQWLNHKPHLEQQCQRIFCLLVYLDPVLTSQDISIIRDLSRECIKLRTSFPEHVAELNIIITIIAEAFGQADLI